MPRVAIIAGEVSGDRLGAGLIRAVLKKNPEVVFEGVAGPDMQSEGCDAWYPADDLAVMGLTEVLKDLPRLLSIKNDLVNRWIKNPPDLFVGIDAPDFNLRIAKKLKAVGIRTAHYVSPSVWAWRQGRVKAIEKAVDELFCLLPFEPEYYANTTVRAHFVGHPLADQIQLQSRDFISKHSSSPLIAVLPGSRTGEIKKLAIPFIQTIAILANRYPQARFSIPAAKPEFILPLKTLVDRYAPGVPVNILNGEADSLLAEADFALVASGTATLEAMLHTCPMVVGYRMAASTAWLLKISFSLKTKYFSLPNILAGECVVPEIMQNEMTPQRLSDEIAQLLDNPEMVIQMRSRFIEMHRLLQQNTNQIVADIILNQLSQNSLVSDAHATP